MNNIKIANGNNELTFKSWQEVGKHFSGKDTPVSSATASRMIERNGWKIVSVEKTSGTRSKGNLIESLIKRFSTVDKEKIKELQRRRNEIVKDMKTSSDATKILKINKEIEKLSNPSLTKDDLMQKLSELYDLHMKAQETKEEA